WIIGNGLLLPHLKGTGGESSGDGDGLSAGSGKDHCCRTGGRTALGSRTRDDGSGGGGGSSAEKLHGVHQEEEPNQERNDTQPKADPRHDPGRPALAGEGRAL